MMLVNRFSGRVILFLVLGITVARGADQPGEADRVVSDFFADHCLHCHNADSTDSTFRVDASLTGDFKDAAMRARWLEIVDVLNSHQMPPEDEVQPAPESVAKVVDWITANVVEAEKGLRENQVVMRRLNRLEYRNTIEALTGILVDTSHFPEDPMAGGFDNIGAALAFSPMQMELYLETAQQIMADAIVEGDRPTAIQWHFEVDSGDSDRNRVLIDGQRPIVNGGKNPVVDGFKVLHHDSWDKKLNVRDFVVKNPGRYNLRIRLAGRIPTRAAVVASAKEILEERFAQQLAKQPEREKSLREQFNRDLAHFEEDRIYEYGAPRIKVVLTLGGQPKTVAEFDVEAGLESPDIVEVPLEMTTERAGVTIEYAYSIPKVLENFWMQGRDTFERPEVYVDWIELQGPIFESWPPPSHQKVSPREITDENENVEAGRTIGEFVRAAFRRPVDSSEITPYVAFYNQSRQRGETIHASLRAALAAVLVSPHFLYLVESEDGQSSEASRLTAHQLACRLSYFLHSGPPDQELMNAADDGSLLDASRLIQQTRRLLDSSQSEQLIVNFADQWLGLRNIGANPPAADLFPHYDRHLEVSMVEEGRAMFRTVVREDRDLLDLIDPDYVVINERLARFYGIPNVKGDAFRKVSVGKDAIRAGILTQASMLTMTSNGTRTSPVKRGTWILANVLGADPGLPVANAGDIAPKVPGIDKATVRQRLEIHRELPQCARCHDKIDPLGLALENFNAAGQFRLQEGFGYKGRIQQNDPEIDASSKLPDGTIVNGPLELRRAIRQQEEQFLRCLAEKVFTYALGRELTLSDSQAVQQVVQATQAGGRRFDVMVEAIVLSEAFQNH